MKLPFSFGKKEKKEYFLAILLKDEKVTTVIFEESLGKVHVVGQHDANFSDSIETITTDEFLDVLDKAISGAESTTTQLSETQKTIFGVKENWVEESKLKKEYLARLKKASDALGLVPIGFLITHEAVAHLMQVEEGAPVSAVLIEIGKKTLAVSLLRAGRVVETKRVEIEEEHVAKLTDKILHHFTNYEVLPSRVVIFGDSQNTEKLSQEFISHTWSKDLPFLHVPQVTIQQKGFEAKAVLLGAATQMGFELLRDDQSEETTSDAAGTEPDSTDTKKTDDQREIEQTDNEDFGFVKEKDILVRHASDEVLKNEPQEKEEKIEELLPIEESEEQIAQDRHTKITILATLLGIVKTTFVTVRGIFSGFLGILSNLKGGSKLLPVVLFIAGITAIVIFYIFSLKATVTLVIQPKTIEKSQTVAFSTTAATNLQEKIIASEEISVNEDGSITKPATGKKEVGEKAKGTITIYSTLQKEQSFNKGTIVTSSNDLTFALEDSVKVASASGASDPKTIKVTVVANDIGKESNLPSGTKFSVGSLSSSEVEAKNDTAFSGGTKKEITAVSKADLEKAMDELSKNLEQKAKEDLEKKIKDDEKLLGIIKSAEFVKKTFDKKEGEEAQSVKLTATIEYKSLSYKKSDAQDLSQGFFDENSKDTSYTIENIKQDKDKKVSANIHAKAFLLPKLDNNKLAEKIAGKSFSETKSVLLDLPQIADVHITLSPSLPFLPSIMPKIAKNISFTMTKE